MSAVHVAYAAIYFSALVSRHIPYILHRSSWCGSIHSFGYRNPNVFLVSMGEDHISYKLHGKTGTATCPSMDCNVNKARNLRNRAHQRNVYTRIVAYLESPTVVVWQFSVECGVQDSEKVEKLALQHCLLLAVQHGLHKLADFLWLHLLRPSSLEANTMI